MSARKFEQRVLNVIKRNRLWTDGDIVTLAVSGGVDSMVMLDILHKTARSHKGKIQVVTFDHGFRIESAEEVRFVESVCHKLSIPCIIHALNLVDGPNKQERARQARRSFLYMQDGLIATAHHASDQAETILFRMLRGSGLDGLKGMCVQSGRWLKPLLMEFKEDILNYANERRLEWREDSSNTASTRGVIRQLWSEMAVVHPKPEKSMFSVARMLSRDAEYLDSLAVDALHSVLDDNQVFVDNLRELHPAIQSRVLRRWLWNNKIDVSGQQIEMLLKWTPSRNGALFQLQSSVYIKQFTGRWLLC